MTSIPDTIKTAYIACEFETKESAGAFLQRCMNERPSVRVTLADQRTVIIPRDQTEALQEIMTSVPPKAFHEVRAMSERTPHEAALARGWLREAFGLTEKEKAYLDALDERAERMRKVLNLPDPGEERKRLLAMGIPPEKVEWMIIEHILTSIGFRRKY